MTRSRPPEGDFRYRHSIEIRYNDTDALGHVNNAVYFSYFEMARGGYYTAVVGHPFGTGPDADKRTFYTNVETFEKQLETLQRLLYTLLTALSPYPSRSVDDDSSRSEMVQYYWYFRHE